MDINPAHIDRSLLQPALWHTSVRLPCCCAKLLSMDDDPPMQEAVDAGAVPLLLLRVREPVCFPPNLQGEACLGVGGRHRERPVGATLKRSSVMGGTGIARFATHFSTKATPTSRSMRVGR